MLVVEFPLLTWSPHLLFLFYLSLIETGKFSEEVLRSYDDSRRIFVCRTCGTERKRSDRLALHLQWHEDHPGESYQTRNNCKICGRFNATYFMLKMHMTRMHTDMPKTFQCLQDGCGKAFRVSFIRDWKIEKIHFLSISISRNIISATNLILIGSIKNFLCHICSLLIWKINNWTFIWSLGPSLGINLGFWDHIFWLFMQAWL